MIKNFTKLIKRLDNIDQRVKSKIKKIGETTGNISQGYNAIINLFSKRLDNINERLSKF